MASGTFSIGTKGYLEARISWNSTANGSTKNNSTVTAKLQIRRTNSYTTTGTWGYSLKIGSKSKSGGYYAAVSSSWVTIATLEGVTVAHAASGAGSAYIYGKVTGPSGTSMSGYSLSNSKTVTLDKIARGATISSAPNFTDEDNPTIKYSNPAGSAADTLQACIWVADTKVYLAEYQDISKSGTSYTFDLTDAEREAMRKACVSAKSLKVRFYVTTVIDGATMPHSYLEKTLTITNAAPIIEPSAVVTDAKTVELAGNTDTVIKGYSTAEVAVNATAQKHATIKSYKITNGSKGLAAASGTITAADSGSFVFSVTDSRGYTTSKTLNKTLIEYVAPTCKLVASNPNAEGEMSLKISGSCFNGSFGAVQNALTVQYCYSASDGEPCEWITVPATVSGDSYSAEVGVTGLDYRLKYTFKARVVDALSSAVSPSKTVKAIPVFDWGENDFNFNVPVVMQDTLQLKNAADAAAETYNAPALVIGDPEGQHFELDYNELYCKTDAATPRPFYMNETAAITASGTFRVPTITVGCSSALTLSTSRQKITLGSEYASYSGGFFTLASGGVRCEKAGRVMVSGTVYCEGTTAGNCLVACAVIGENASANVYAQTGSKTYTNVAITPKVHPVEAGEIIYLHARVIGTAGGSVAANNSTTLTVQYIE